MLPGWYWITIGVFVYTSVKGATERVMFKGPDSKFEYSKAYEFWSEYSARLTPLSIVALFANLVLYVFNI